MPSADTSSHPPRATRKFGRAVRVLLGAFIALAVVIALFDWNWFRPSLQHYLSERSGRDVRIGDLQVSFGASLVPTVRLRDVHVPNAAWASAQPFAVADEVAFTFGWRSLFERKPVVTKLVLRHADIDMERQADGLRNWRLTRPDDRGPPRMHVLALEAHDSKIRFVHGGLQLELIAAARTAPDAALAEGFDQLIAFHGHYRGAAFEGESLTGPLITLQGTDRLFALRGQARSGKTTLHVDGQVGDLLKLNAMDAELRGSGPSLSQLAPFVPGQWPASRPFEVSTHLKKDQGNYDFTRMQLALGASDAEGDLKVREANDRPQIDGRLVSRTLAWADLQPAVKPSASADRSNNASDGGTTNARDGGKLFSTRKLALSSLGQLDGRFSLEVMQLQMPPGLPPLQGLKLKAELNRGVLVLNEVDLGLAGGHLSGQFTLDSQQQPPTGQAELRLRAAHVDQLWPGMPAKARIDGVIDGQAHLQGHGESVAAWLGHLNGSAGLTIGKGSIANKLDAKLGLNGGKLLSAMVSGTEQIPIHCGAVQIELKDGQGRSKTLVLDTEQTHVDGSATLNLDDERFELLLVPQPKKRSLLALHSAIRIHGPLNDAEIDLSARPEAPPASSCSASSVASARAA